MTKSNFEIVMDANEERMREKDAKISELEKRVEWLVDGFKERVTQARSEALEEAAKVAERSFATSHRILGDTIAKEIRALKGKG